MLAEGFWGIRYKKVDKITIIENSIPEIIGDKISKFEIIQIPSSGKIL